MNIVGFHAKNFTIANSLGEVIQSPPYLKFLLHHPEDTIQVIYKMDDCLESLLQIIGIQNQKKDELIETTRLFLKPYKFRYVPNKFFSVKRNNHSMSYFCDLSQYQLETKILLANHENDKEYCLRIANEAQILGQKIYETLQNLGMNITSLSSLERIHENAKLESKNFSLTYKELLEYINQNLKSNG